MDNCKPCDKTRAILKNRKTDFTEYVVTDGEAERELFEKFGGKYLPFIIHGKHSITSADKYSVISFLAESYGPDILTSRENRLLSNHFDPDGNPLVVMYGTQTCGYCTKEKAFFDSEGINYTELDIKQNKKAKRLYRELEGNGTPLTYVGYRRVNGFDKKQLKTALSDYSI